MRDEKGRFIKGFIPNNKSNRTDFTKFCPTCKKLITKRGTESWKHWDMHKLCRTCSYFQIGQMAGKNNPNWANGISKLYQQIRNLWQYKDWQAQCRIRDNYTCQKCGRYLKNLNERCSVDHFVKSFARIIYDNNIKTIEEALVCKELWDINNGRVLCWPCHIKTPNYRRRIKRKTTD